jgi:hypothetical protein
MKAPLAEIQIAQRNFYIMFIGSLLLFFFNYVNPAILLGILSLIYYYVSPIND